MSITAPRYEGRVQVRDGRSLGIAEFGPPHAEQTVLWFHGTPGARKQIPENARRLAFERCIRVIGIDRPGVGLSTAHRYHRLLDFTDDLEVAIDRLGVERFSVVGLSGGAPYALAAAHAFADRVPTVGVLSGVVPSGGADGTDGGLVGIAVRFKPLLPVLSEPFGAVMTNFVRVAKPVAPFALDMFARISPPGDREIFAVPEHREMFLDDVLTGGRHGMKAAGYDAVLFTRYWGFSVRDVATRVVWWQGDDDYIVPLSHAEHIVPLLPHGELRVQPGGGHLCGLGLGDEVLETILDW